MPPAIIGGVIAGVGAVGAAAIGSSATSGAAKANQQAADAAAGETRAAREQAYSTLNPFVQGGTAAGSQINALLGLSSGPDYAAYVQANPDILADYQKQSTAGEAYTPTGGMGGMMGAVENIIAKRNGGGATPAFTGDMAAFGQQHWQKYGQNENRTLPTGQDAATQAFDQFRNSTGYQFRLGEGMNALNSGYAGAGTIKSGAAMRAANEYGQNFASAEFGNYLNALGNQQGVGLQAGSAAAGVGVNAANSLGNIAMQNGANQANAGLVRASTIGQGFAGAANALGTILGPQTNYAASMPTASQINTNTLASLRGY